jgi:hypothetical protein
MTDTMTRQLPVVIAATVGVIGLIAALSWPGTAQQRLQAVAQGITGALETPANRIVPPPGQIAGLSAGPRIIHVPPNFGDGAWGSDEPVYRDERRHVAPSEPLQPAGSDESQQDPSSRSELNRASSTKGSLTPIYPTPRWNLGKQ